MIGFSPEDNGSTNRRSRKNSLERLQARSLGGNVPALDNALKTTRSTYRFTVSKSEAEAAEWDESSGSVQIWVWALFAVYQLL